MRHDALTPQSRTYQHSSYTRVVTTQRLSLVHPRLDLSIRTRIETLMPYFVQWRDRQPVYCYHQRSHGSGDQQHAPESIMCHVHSITQAGPCLHNSVSTTILFHCTDERNAQSSQTDVFPLHALQHRLEMHHPRLSSREPHKSCLSSRISPGKNK